MPSTFEQIVMFMLVNILIINGNAHSKWKEKLHQLSAWKSFSYACLKQFSQRRLMSQENNLTVFIVF